MIIFIAAGGWTLPTCVDSYLILLHSPYYRRATQVAKSLHESRPKDVTYETKSFPRDAFHEFRIATLARFNKPADFHRSCPLVYTQHPDGSPNEIIGGCDAFVNLAKHKYGLDL